MADEIKLKAPTVEQQVVVNINGEDKLKSFADTLDKILKEHPSIEFVQLQINYLDWDNEGIQSKFPIIKTFKNIGKPNKI